MEFEEFIVGVVGIWVAAKVCVWAYRTVRGKVMVYRAKQRLYKIRSKKLQLPPVSTEVKERILGLTASQLIEEMKAGRLTCVEVMSTYIERAATIGREYNLTGEEPFEEALAAAEVADKLRIETPDSLGILFGLPISIKDHIQQRGCSASGGAIQHSEAIADSDSDLVALLRKEGGIPFVRSNLTQLMMWFECESNLYGKALNPWDKTRTTGGSSGGEGGLLSSRCSPLGIGTDSGGSIRIPSSFCGVYGFQPTPQRVRFQGVFTAHKDRYDSGGHVIPMSIGPIGRCVDDLTLVLRTWWQPEMFKRDPNLVPLKFNAEMYESSSGTKPLRIGYYTYDGVFECYQSSTRVINKAKAALEAMGHELVEFKVPNMGEVLKHFVAVSMAVGSIEIEESLQGEPPAWFYSVQLALGSSWLLNKIGIYLLRLLNFGRASKYADVPTNINSKEFMALNQFFTDYQITFTKAWTDLKLDVVIGPANGLPACQHGMSDLMFMPLSYLILWNSVQYPSGVIPASQVYTSEETYVSQFQDGITKKAKKVLENSAGLPVALLVAALPYEDEKALGVMKALEGVFKFHQHPI